MQNLTNFQKKQKSVNCTTNHKAKKEMDSTFFKRRDYTKGFYQLYKSLVNDGTSNSLNGGSSTALNSQNQSMH